MTTEILRVLCGSRAYGLEDENSDYDYHAIFIEPTWKMLEIGANIKTSNFTLGHDDNTSWEVEHFLELALNCTPTVLETFYAPVVSSTKIGDTLLMLRPHVLQRKRIYDAFRGYAKNQRTKMFDPAAESGSMDGKSRTRLQCKAAVAYLRSLYHGMQLLEDGTYDTVIPHGTFRNFLVDLRHTESPSLAKVIEWAELLEVKITKAYEQSTVQEKPNLEVINYWLYHVRKDNFDAVDNK